MSAEALYREHGDALFRYLVRLSGDADDASDLLQETFCRLVERPPRRRDNVRAWLFKVATNLLRDARRKDARRAVLVGPGPVQETLSDPPPQPDRATEASEAVERVRGAMAALTPRDRAVLLMREEGFAHREIAEAVGTTTGSVGTMIARALDRLSKELRPNHG